MLKNCLRRKSFLFFVWGSGRGEPDPFCGVEWSGGGAMAEAWYTGRPAGLVFGGPGRGGLVFGAPGAWGRAVFGGPARLGQGGLST